LGPKSPDNRRSSPYVNRPCCCVLSISPQKLDRPLPTKDGGILRTIGDACDYMTGIGKKRELLSHWQRVAKLILAKEDVLTVSRALELALFRMPS
jgi:hypothetical protein